MIKRLHNQLLENYPLIWNLRLPGILAVLGIYHLLHFIIGYASYNGDYSLSVHNPASIYFSTSFFMFSIIGSLVIFILWLTRVFRNNAFKSFYPYNNARLFQEFMVFFVVCLLNITCYYSYTYGYILHARNKNNQSENKKDIEVYNSVIALLQYNKENYKIENRCYPAPYPLSKRYKHNDRNSEADRLTGNDYYYLSNSGQEFSVAAVDSMKGGMEYSYLNSCNSYYLNLYSGQKSYGYNDEESRIFYASNLNKLLNDPQKLKAHMQDFLKLCDKHGIKYKINTDDWFKWVYNPPYFPVEYLIFQKTYYPGLASLNAEMEASVTQSALQLNPKAYYIELNRLQNILQNTQKAYDYRFDAGPLLGFFYAALFAAILIFTFRTTSRRIWMITLIGSALICLITGAFTAVLAIGGSKDGILYFYLAIIISFCIIHLLSGNKTVSGVTLNWFTWSLPAVSTLILAIIDKDFVEDYYETYFFICFLIYLAILAIFIVPRYRAWQAMPEN